mgnify:CR=1 FL=1
MEIGEMIKSLRIKKGLTQENFSEKIGVSVQTISRWENCVNYPDITLLPLLASFFSVTTDFLLGMKGEPTMAKLLNTVETFELKTREEAEALVEGFKKANFPVLKDFVITEENDIVIVKVTKEFNTDINNMKFE